MIIFDKIIQIGSLFRYESWELLLAAQSLHWVWAEFLLDIKSNLDWTDWNYIFILKMKKYLICSKYPVKNPIWIWMGPIVSRKVPRTHDKSK